MNELDYVVFENPNYVLQKNNLEKAPLTFKYSVKHNDSLKINFVKPFQSIKKKSADLMITKVESPNKMIIQGMFLNNIIIYKILRVK